MENKNTLGRQIKISSILVQRNFIKEQLEHLAQNPSKDGQHVYRYVGHIFPENLAWLINEDFYVLSQEFKDGPFQDDIYLISPSVDINLTEEEMDLAKTFVQPKKTTEERAREAIERSNEVLRSIFSEERLKEFKDSLASKTARKDDSSDKTTADTADSCKVDMSMLREGLDDLREFMKEIFPEGMFSNPFVKKEDADKDGSCPQTPTDNAGSCDWCKADTANEVKEDASDPVPPPYSV